MPHRQHRKSGLARAVVTAVAILYGLGAVMHLMNITGLSGYEWADAPLKWKMLDVTYLLLNLGVVVGLSLGWMLGYGLFFITSISQIILYTVYRSWILDVPPGFMPNPDQIGALDSLVGIHGVSIAAMFIAIHLRRPIRESHA